jgi:hypothetical protein
LAGGVFGGVGSPVAGIKESVKVSTDWGRPKVILRLAGGSKGMVSSTITIDWLPLVMPASLMGR